LVNSRTARHVAHVETHSPSVWVEESSPFLEFALALVVPYPPLVVLPHALAFLVHFHAMVSYVPVSLIGRAAMSFAACRRAGVTTWCTTWHQQEGGEERCCWMYACGDMCSGAVCAPCCCFLPVLPAMQSRRFAHAPASYIPVLLSSCCALECFLTTSVGPKFVFPHMCSYATSFRGDAEQAMGLNYDRVQRCEEKSSGGLTKMETTNYLSHEVLV